MKADLDITIDYMRLSHMHFSHICDLDRASPTPPILIGSLGSAVLGHYLRSALRRSVCQESGMASPLEVVFLLANLRAVGLMPDSDFQQIKPGLIELIRRSVYRESGAGEPQTSLAQFLDESAGETKPPPYDEWSSRVGDEELWKHVVSIFLKLAKDVEDGTFLARLLLPDDAPEFNVVASSISFEELSNHFDGQGLPTSPLTDKRPSIFDSLEAQSYELNRAASRAAIDDLSLKVEALEREIAGLRRQSIRPDFRDDHAATQFHSLKADRNGTNGREIAKLQDDLVRELNSAAFYDGDGNSVMAGAAKARAARIESKLRSLGA